MDKISIIVPVYQVENYIIECIESIINQTFKNFELILVDDGSLDNSGKICDEYALIDNRIKVIHQENMGLSAARNTGIENAIGKYICFIDSDDCISHSFCQIMYQIMENNSCDFCVCDYLKFCDNDMLPYSRDEKGHVSFVSNYDYLNIQLSNGFSACGKLYRREIFNNNRFYVGKLHEDIIWSADLAVNLNNGVVCTTDKLYFYRQNMSGIMARSKRKCNPDWIFAGEYLLNKVKTKRPELLSKSFKYAVLYPWSFVDGIYVHLTFKENEEMLKKLKLFLDKNRELIEKNNEISPILKFRMKLFSKSFILYAINAYSRLFRVYLYKLINKDAYKDGHGI